MLLHAVALQPGTRNGAYAALTSTLTFDFALLGRQMLVHPNRGMQLHAVAPAPCHLS